MYSRSDFSEDIFMQIMTIILFLLFYLFCYYIENLKKYRNFVLFFFCSTLSIIAGCRSMDWNDTATYANSFKYTSTISEFSVSDTPYYAYDEVGFYFLSSIIRTFTSNYTTYFVVISVITFIFLYKSLRRYCIYPLLGLCVYIGRFFLSRNMMQIRAALAIVIIVFAIKWIEEKNLKKYALYVLAGTLLHYTVIVALPFYWLNKIRYSNKSMLFITAVSFAIMIFLSPVYENLLSAFVGEYMINYVDYVTEGNFNATGKGLSNLMIYYQLVIFLIYTIREDSLKNLIPYYYTIRNGYLYSIVILILLSPFLVLSGRLSTIFATLEIFIVPAIFIGVNPRTRLVMVLCIGVAVAGIFYLNILKLYPKI